MAVLNQPHRDPGQQRAITIIGILAVVAIILSLFSLMRSQPKELPHTEGGLSPAVKVDMPEALFADGEMRVGYGGFPPYTITDAGGDDPTGFSVDLVHAIAAQHDPPLKVKWVLFNWDTLKADLLSKKFDFIADPTFQTVPRAVDFGLCSPYSYFGIACAIVRVDDDRFTTFQDLDRADITIALAEGWTSSEYARQHLTKPEFKSIPVQGDAVSQLDEVLQGRVDVALNDVPSVAQYVRAHPDSVKALWLQNPPSRVGGGFITRKEDFVLREFLEAATSIVIADGTLEQIDRQWKAYGYLPKPTVLPGQGLN